MNVTPGAHKRCRDGDNCTGPGCRKNGGTHDERDRGKDKDKGKDKGDHR